MVPQIEANDYEDYEEGVRRNKSIHRRKFNQGKKVGKKDDSSDIDLEPTRESLLRQIFNTLTKFPRNNELQDIVGSAYVYIKQPYIQWLERSFIEGYPHVNPSTDFQFVKVLRKKHMFSLIHETSGIHVNIFDEENDFKNIRHLLESKLIIRLEEHVQVWQQLSKIDDNQFDLEDILNQILPTSTNE